MLGSKLKIFTIFSLTAFCAGLIFFSFTLRQTEAAGENDANDMDSAIEAALYTRTEFFSADAIVPFPTAEAHKRLAKVSENFPAEPKIFLKLAELNEKLEKFDEAANDLNKFIELQSDKLISLNELAAFYNRRGRFEKQAEVLTKMIDLAPPDRRGEFFALLINLARTHKLEKYLKADFYREFIARDESAFSILTQYADKLIEEKNFEEALKFIRETRAKFPGQKEYFLRTEVSVLVLQNKKREAEDVYIQAFEPDWSPVLTEEFYSFLTENNRFKTYGNELTKKFRQDPADFRTAIRLIHFLKYDGDSTENVILQLEKAKNEKQIEWSADELLSVSIHLISDGNADLASRFLYTLFLKQEAKPNGELRAKILYQLFALLCDAENERIALTRGNLDFYRDIAASDTNPGITNGILSLIFADKNPGRELEEKEKSAVKLFNRAAAYRIFSEFKQEFPQTPELAQMYLDIVRLYTAEKDFEIAGQTLAEFEEKFKDSAGLPSAALRLADAFAAAGQNEKEREIYQKTLDFIGSKRDLQKPLITAPAEEVPKIPGSNRGIHIPDETDQTSDNYYAPRRVFTDFISPKVPEISYREVLNRFVASLAGEKKTQEILALYSNEITKYPDQPVLYEDFLSWLGQTNFTDKQLEIYKNAISKFQNKTWRDKLARWYIKNQRKAEFGELSHELIGRFSDAETQEYLWTFIDGNVLANPESFEGKLYFALYSKAHQRFPHNQIFVAGLLKYFQATKQPAEWQKLTAQYYFEMPEIRKEFINDLSKRGELRAYLLQAVEKSGDNNSIETLPYKLFRADAAAHLSNFEQSVAAYRELNLLYPNTAEFSERLINFTRSFGQTDRKFLQESAEITHRQAEFLSASFNNRTRAGELRAELGDYAAAKIEWRKLILIAKGEPATHLETATVFWDYFQFDDALDVIENLRSEMKDDSLYAFQTGAIYEAKQNKEKTVSEYVKQLGAASEDEEILLNISRTKKRLVQLSKRQNFNQLIKTAFENEKRKQTENSALVLNYAHFLVKSDQRKEAVNLLNTAVAQKSGSENFLLEAKLHFEALEDKSGERAVLKKLADSAENKKNAISYQLELAEDLSDSGEKEKSAEIVADLIRKYPANYGVLSEADEFYQRAGFREKSLQVLQNGVRLGRGKYLYIFKRKLAARLFSYDRINDAEQILLGLHAENKGDTEVFDELANSYVRQNKPELLRKIAAETLSEVKLKSIETRDINYEIAGWRRRLINSFTRLADYDSAIAQHIEIINRLPDEEENIESAIKYVRRYGGAEKLLAFYRDLAEQAYKNYRWTLVLARIYEADRNFDKAIENYKLAIHNQPEMVDLYVALAGVYEKAKNTDAAIETIDKVLELTHETPNYLKRKIEILENAGRAEEAALVREKMTGIKRAENTNTGEDFAEAARLSETERAKAVELYRNAFNELRENPLDAELKSADIIGYAKTVRSEDALDKIAADFWALREKLIAEADGQTAENAGKARNHLTVFDGALPQAIGSIAAQNATGNELAALFKDIQDRVENQPETDRYQTFALLENLIASCGFDKLNEKILLARKDQTFFSGTYENYHLQLRAVLRFYEERGNFARVLEILEAESARDTNRIFFEYPQKIAQISRTLGNDEKELSALKTYFESPKKEFSTEDILINRYFERLYAAGELLDFAETSASPHQIQLINFLIAKREKSAAHRAIENASFPAIWKHVKNAETALALGEFEAEKSAHFQAALQFAPIGELIRQNNENQLKGEEWFRLAYKFGSWLKLSPDENHKNLSEKYLPAMTENRPKDALEQFNLGVFYLENKDFANALEHLKIAQEMNYSERNLWSKLGTAYFQNGETEQADAAWRTLINTEQTSLEDCELYLAALREAGQAGTARNNLFPLIGKFISETPDENPSAALLIFLRNVSDSFRDETEKTEFWLKLANSGSGKLFIPKYVVEKSLVSGEQVKRFYRFLIERSGGMDVWENDSEYIDLKKMNWSSAEAEAILDQDNNFEIAEAESEKLVRQREYLDYLLQTKEFSEAENLISEIEKSLEEKFPRPVWLRLAKFQTALDRGISPETFQEIKTFTGITDVFDAKQLNPPNAGRLNDVVKLLKTRDHTAKIRDLREAFYARSLALKKYNLSNFTGLAETVFEKGDRESALKLLDLMSEISSEEIRENALRQLHSLDLIKEFSPEKPELFEIQTENNLDKTAALKFAAETAAQFGEIDAAIGYRQKLLANSPENAVNKIELARLFAEKQISAEAFNHLYSVISDRSALRNERWQAVFAARRIFGNNAESWKNLKNNLPDAEMSDAIEAISLAENGNAPAALEVLRHSAIQSPQMLYLQAIIAKQLNQNEIALEAFSEIKNSKIDFGETFGFSEEKPVFQIIKLYLNSGKPLAAIQFADSALEASDAGFRASNSKFRTLADESAENSAQSLFEILGLLSKAAEDSGDFSKAVEFEKKKLALILDEEKRRISENRIFEIERKIIEQTDLPKIDFRVS